MIPPLRRSASVEPDVLAQVMAGDLLGIEITGFFSPAERAEMNARLDADTASPRTPLHGFERHPSPPFLYGRSVVDAAPDLSDYFAAAAAARPGLEALCPGWIERLEGALTGLSGLPCAAPVSKNGHAYAAATVRELPDGQAIGLHIGNAFLHVPQAAELARVVDVGAQLSFFSLLRAPASGGELVVYDLRWEHVAEWYARGDVDVRRPPPAAAALTRIADQRRVAVAEGSLLVFDGGRYFHQVSPVKGPVPRRTLGGFAAKTRDGEALRYWG